MSSLASKEKYDSYAKRGMLNGSRHATLPLTLYTYTRETQFDGLWNGVTLSARGLVLDDSGRCVVRCIPKFFNSTEAHIIPPDIGEPVAYAKMDGSLIQVANDPEYGLVVTSRRLFKSAHAIWATEILAEAGYTFEQGKSYIFELLHPDNRIVVDYKGTTGLVLLAVIHNLGGNEDDIHTARYAQFNRAEVIADVPEYMQKTNVEGVVLVYRGGYRVKMKTQEYIRLHRIMTDFTEKRVWEVLSVGGSLDLVDMPEEFDKWLKATISDLTNKFNAISESAHAEAVSAETLSDKELGISQDFKHKSLVFQIRKGISVDKTIWRMIKPKGGDNA